MTADVDETHPSAWSTLKEAVRGTHQDFTEAPIGRAVVLLAVPMVLEMLMESVFAVADVFFVGRLGASAVATVGLTESLMVIVYALAIGLAIGAAATVAAAPMESPMATAYISIINDSVMPTVAMALAPSRPTKKMSATANTDSISISSTIGTARRITARPIGASV